MGKVAAYKCQTAGGILRGKARKHLLFDENELQFTILGYTICKSMLFLKVLLILQEA